MRLERVAACAVFSDELWTKSCPDGSGSDLPFDSCSTTQEFVHVLTHCNNFVRLSPLPVLGLSVQAKEEDSVIKGKVL